MKRSVPYLLTIASATALMACASTPKPNAQLESAREAIAAARNDAYAQTSARELQRASASLDKAEQAWKENDDQTEVNHYAYLAQGFANVAVLNGRVKAAEQQAALAIGEREKVLLEARSQEAQSAQQRANSLENQLHELAAKQTDRGLVVTLPDVLFDTGKSTIKPGSNRALQRLAAVLNENPNRKVVVEGFTDSQGSNEANLDLSNRRAAAVKEAMVAQGVSADRVMVRGYGEDYPVASNDTPSGRQQNRRVEIVLSDENGRVTMR